MKKVKKHMTYLAVLVVLAALIFCVIYYRLLTDTLKSKTYENLKNVVEISSVAISEGLKDYTDQISLPAEYLSTDADNLSVEEAYGVLCKDSSFAYNDFSNMQALFIACADGTAYKCSADVEGLPSETFDFSNKDFFENALRGKMYISSPFKTEEFEEETAAISVPVLNSAGEAKYVAVGFYKREILDEVFERLNISDDFISYIADSENHIIAKTDNFHTKADEESANSAKDEDSDLNSENGFYSTFEGSSFGYSEIVYENIKYVSVYKAIDDKWVLAVAVPEATVIRSYLPILYPVLAAVIIGAAVIVYFIMGFARKDGRLKAQLRSVNKFKEKSLQIYIVLRRDGQILSANKRFLEDTGYSSYELQKMSIFDIVADNYANDFRTYLYKCSTGEQINEFEIPIQGKSSLIHYLWFIRTDKTLGINKLQLIAANVQRYKEAEEKMNRLVYFDSLTGFRNGVWLENHFNAIIEDESYKGKKIAIAYIDIDNFKYVNDLFGHHMGDKIIIEMCKRIDQIQNDNAVVCRRGGDELSILIENAESKEEIDKYLNEVVDKISEEYYINSVKHTLTASIGVAIYPDDAENYNDIFTCADIAMNNAKENGKNLIVYFESEMQETMRELITMENELKRAVENEEFVLYYQPQYNIETGRLYGFEALIRWISPTKGFINPAKFISHAERTQMIIPMGDWILNEACGFANEAVEMGRDDICISVNVSVIQMLCSDYSERTIDIVKKNNTNPKNIKLEITESVFMETIDDMVKKITELNKNGLFFALDDFGTGYSSLNYLKKIPIKVLKIDKSFVDMIVDEDDNRDIITSIINLAHDMNLEVVAEGIEDKVQLEWLRSRGCNIAQGYYTGKPMPREEALKELYKNIYDDRKGA